MPEPTDTGFAASLQLQYDGGEADQNQLHLSHLAVSLAGWDQFLRLTTSSLLHGSLSGSTNIQGALLDIRAQAIRQGSFEVCINMVVSGIIGGAAWATARNLWPFVQTVYREHLEAKRRQFELELAAERIQQAVAYTMPPDHVTDTSNENEGSMEFTKAVDEALAEAALPVARSVTSATLKVLKADPIIAMSHHDAVLPRRPYGLSQPDRPTSGLQRRSIRLLQLNVGNGWGRFQFIEPTESFEMRQQECKIQDPELHRPHNIYTRSLDDRTDIEVDMSLVLREDSRIRSHYWNIFGPDVAPPGSLQYK